MAVALAQQPAISQGDVVYPSVDCTPYLDGNELVTGTPTVVEVTTTDLTLSNTSINTATLVILGETIAIGKAIQFKMIGQQAGTTYRVRLTFSTDATIPRTKVVDLIFPTSS